MEDNPGSEEMSDINSLNLDRVVFIGRTFSEYVDMFDSRSVKNQKFQDIGLSVWRFFFCFRICQRIRDEICDWL